MGINRIGGGQPPSYNPTVDDVHAPLPPRPPVTEFDPPSDGLDGVDFGPSHSPMFNSMDGIETRSEGVPAPIIDDNGGDGAPPSGGVPAPIIDDNGGGNVPIIDEPDPSGPGIDEGGGVGGPADPSIEEPEDPNDGTDDIVPVKPRPNVPILD